MSHQPPGQLVREHLRHRHGIFFRPAHLSAAALPFDPPIREDVGDAGDRRRPFGCESARPFARWTLQPLDMDEQITPLLESIVGSDEGAGVLGRFYHDHPAAIARKGSDCAPENGSARPRLREDTRLRSHPRSAGFDTAISRFTLG